jgi:hypothetical protein
MNMRGRNNDEESPETVRMTGHDDDQDCRAVSCLRHERKTSPATEQAAASTCLAKG